MFDMMEREQGKVKRACAKQKIILRKTLWTALPRESKLALDG